MVKSECIETSIKKLRPFISVGIKGLAESKDFYLELGFKLLWEQENICELQLENEATFLLAAHFNSDGSIRTEGAKHQMLQLVVEDLDRWFHFVSDLELPKKFKGTKVTEPKEMPWGIRVTFLWDPAGVLWHVVEQD